MDKTLLAYVSDMNDFIGTNWDSFVDIMLEKGFTEEQIDELNGRFGEYLADHV